MTDFHVEVTRVENISVHPNADNLEVLLLENGQQVCSQKGTYKQGDLCVHVPPDSVVPLTDPRFSWLTEARVRAKKLRGVVSNGFVLPIKEVGLPLSVGDDASACLGITKYVSKQDLIAAGETEQDPGLMPKYDIEPLKKYHRMFFPGERVWISEKIHGANARFIHDGKRLWVGSHTKMKAKTAGCMWWDIAERYGLEEKLAKVPGVAVYGEIYGKVQDLNYGLDKAELRVFDALDTRNPKRPGGGWMNPIQLHKFCEDNGLPIVPTIMIGNWIDIDSCLDKPEFLTDERLKTVREMAEGKSLIADHVREGIVVKPYAERTDLRVGRVFFKMAGEGYMTRKEK